MDTDAASNATIEGTKVPTDYAAPYYIKKLEVTKTKRVKTQLPKDKETLLENIKMIDVVLQIPITEYNLINSTLEWLREKYKNDRIPAYLLELQPVRIGAYINMMTSK
ncbi:32108_t:CDS:2 [Gigaspora margarita]|uniref:32108_t:CDS:1 n=1 Tax=Gigaspora margarita TaxID=4874 RepID=A0ABM8VY60_GIGMA|nr:32108_t:CDS:2 [Gigaspora margarita]